MGKLQNQPQTLATTNLPLYTELFINPKHQKEQLSKNTHKRIVCPENYHLLTLPSLLTPDPSKIMLDKL